MSTFDTNEYEFSTGEKHADNLLHTAVAEGNLSTVLFLLQHLRACVNKPVSLRTLFASFVTDVEHREFIESQLFYEVKKETYLEKTTTPLHLAAKHSNVDILTTLLENGANVNATMEGGETPLIIALAYKREEMAKILIHRGADVNRKTVWGKAAVHYAVEIGSNYALELLVAYGADINARNDDGIAPAHIAAEAGNVEILRTLLRHGADVRLKTRQGNTLLHYAAALGHQEVIDLMLEHGTKIDEFVPKGILNLSTFWLSRTEKKKARELVAKYLPSKSCFDWYRLLVVKYVHLK